LIKFWLWQKLISNILLNSHGDKYSFFVSFFSKSRMKISLKFTPDILIFLNKVFLYSITRKSNMNPSNGN